MRTRKGIRVLVGLCIWLFMFSQNSSAEEKRIVIADFEDLSNWQPPGKPGMADDYPPCPAWANFALSAEQVHNGKYSGKFSWDRSDIKPDNICLYYKKRLPEKATEIGCWCCF